MANHITNRLTIIGAIEDVLKVRETIKGDKEDQFVDFNKIAPIPKELQGTVSPMRIISQEEYDIQEEKIAKGELSENEKNWGLSRSLTQELVEEYIEKFGHCDWYGWRTANWGTKWNAYDQVEVDENCIEFDTAWSTPFNLMVHLSKMFPTITFKVEFADEDFGYNVGNYTLLNGEELEENVPQGGSIEALEMALDVKGDEDYYLRNRLIEDIEDEISDYEDKLIQIVHKRGILEDEYPSNVLERLKELALEDEQFERVVKIDEALAKKELKSED